MGEDATLLVADGRQADDRGAAPLKLSRYAVLRNALAIGANVLSVVGIVLVNKVIFSAYNFPYGTQSGAQPRSNARQASSSRSCTLP